MSHNISGTQIMRLCNSVVCLQSFLWSARKRNWFMPTLFYPTCTCISAHPGLNTNIKRALEKPLKWSIAKLRHAGLCHLCRYTFFPCHARCLLEALIPWLPILLPKIPCFKDRCCSLSQSLINILFCLNYSKWSAKSVLLWKIAYRQLISNICVCAECIQILNFCCSPLASLERERFTTWRKVWQTRFCAISGSFWCTRLHHPAREIPAILKVDLLYIWTIFEPLCCMLWLGG